MNGMGRTASRALAAGLVLAASTSCAGYEPLMDVLSGGIVGRQVTGEIRSIDSRRQELRVDTDRRGSARIRFDGRTIVQGRSGRYSVGSLERGDVVRIQLDEGRGLYARRIDLLDRANSGRGRGGGVVRLERVEGSVARIDYQRGTLDLRRSRAGTVQVILPANRSRSLDDQFRRIRRGQNIRVEGFFINGARMELRRIL